MSNYKRHLNKKNDCEIKNVMSNENINLCTNKQDYAELYAKKCQNQHPEPSNSVDNKSEDIDEDEDIVWTIKVKI